MFQTSSIWAWFQGTKMGWKDHWTPSKASVLKQRRKQWQSNKRTVPQSQTTINIPVQLVGYPSWFGYPINKLPWISQLVWTPNDQPASGFETKLTNFTRDEKHHQQTHPEIKLICIYASFFFFLKIIRAMKHSKDQHSDRIQGRPTFPNLPTFETSTTAGSLPVCLGCWRWRWHFYSSTTGSGAGGVDVVVSCFGCLKKTLKSDMAHGKSPCLIGNTEIHLQLWWIFHCHVGFSVVYWLECCSNAVFWRILMDWDDSVREFKMIWMISITNNELHVRKCFSHRIFGVRVGCLERSIDVFNVY